MKAKDFKYEIKQYIKDDKRDLVIIDRKYIKDKNGWNYKYYKYKCNKCGFDCGEHYIKGQYKKEYWVSESSLKTGNDCACCRPSHKVTVLGINTIWDTDRWMIDLGVSEEDAKRYTKASNQKIEVACPDCGVKKSIAICDIYTKKSISCTNCGDGVSYPEKFMMNVLNQLCVEFKRQYSPEWIKNKLYDFYLPKYNIIIETHGKQHYEYSGRGRSLAEEQENDKYKRELALENCVSEYIVIDCRYSEMDFIKNNILDSEFSNIFDLSKIDWLKCEELALKNIVKEVCEYWNNKKESETTGTIANNNSWGIKDRGTISKYLKKGSNLDWCDYDGKEELKKSVSKNGKSNSKSVEIFKDGISLGIFESCAELERQSEDLFGVRLLKSKISSVCIGKRKTHKGFVFRYLDKLC